MIFFFSSGAAVGQPAMALAGCGRRRQALDRRRVQPSEAPSRVRTRRRREGPFFVASPDSTI